MTMFISLATLMIVAAATLLAIPLLRRPKSLVTGADRGATNINIFRDQLAELEHEHQEGSLTDTDFEQAKSELQRRLLEDVRPEAEAGKEADRNEEPGAAGRAGVRGAGLDRRHRRDRLVAASGIDDHHALRSSRPDSLTHSLSASHVLGGGDGILCHHS